MTERRARKALDAFLPTEDANPTASPKAEEAPAPTDPLADEPDRLLRQRQAAWFLERERWIRRRKSAATGSELSNAEHHTADSSHDGERA